MAENRETAAGSDEGSAVCAVNAAVQTESDQRTAGELPNARSRNVLGKELLSKGVKVSQSSGRIEIDVNIIARYGCKIPQVAWDIQENVKTEVKEITDLKVNAVNIHVQGVEKDDQK